MDIVQKPATTVHTFPLFPSHTLTVLLYNNVTDAATIVPSLTKQSLSAAVLQTSYIASMFTLLSSANRALHNATHNQLKTHAIESELLYNLSPSHSISYAFKTFGVQDDSSSVVACMFDATPEALRQLNAIIKGQQVQDVESTLNSMSEEKSKRLIKLYKIKASDLDRRTLPDAIDNILSVRNFKSR